MAQVRYLPVLQVIKNERSYILHLPLNAPYDETEEACRDMAAQVLEIKKEHDEARLKQEAENAKAEAQADAESQGDTNDSSSTGN